MTERSIEDFAHSIFAHSIYPLNRTEAAFNASQLYRTVEISNCSDHWASKLLHEADMLFLKRIGFEG
ncbi:hypothetical protein ASZ90_009362 [hydrocarbon metagenome]|uniref:Uncharacterized protein n=1 Tax=hydrocarbon metagenome TaxID=938273 RepID=A0A0W8FJ03_9ZZZZ